MSETAKIPIDHSDTAQEVHVHRIPPHIIDIIPDVSGPVNIEVKHTPAESHAAEAGVHQTPQSNNANA